LWSCFKNILPGVDVEIVFCWIMMAKQMKLREKAKQQQQQHQQKI